MRLGIRPLEIPGAVRGLGIPLCPLQSLHNIVYFYIFLQLN